MANRDINMRVKYSAEFDTSKISEGLKDIRKQLSSSHIGEDLRKQLETALNKVEVNIPALKKISAKGEFNTKELEAFQKLVQQVSKDMQALDKLAGEADFTKSFSEVDTEKIKQFEKQLSDVENKIKSTKQEIIKNFSGSDQGKINGKNNNSLNNVIEQLLDVPPDKIEEKLNEIVEEAENQTKNAQEKLSEIFSKSNKFKTENDLVNFLYGENSGVSIEHGNVTRLKDQLNAIREGFLSFDEDTPIEDVKAHIQSFIELINDPAFQNTEGKKTFLSDFIPEEILERLKEFQNDIPGLKELLGGEQLKLLADGEAEKLKITQEQAAFLKQRLDELINTQKLTKEQSEAVAKALGLINEKAEEGKKQIHAEEAQINALGATFGGLAHRIESSISALAIFNKSMQIVRRAIKSVEDLDAAFTQIAIVSEQSSESAWKMFDSFNKLAKQYSITTKDLAEGAKLFYQQGLNAADTMKMVEASTVSAALGEVTMTEAANTLTAAIQGYNESAAVAMDYTDKIAMVGAVSAADFNELSAAMEKTASSAYTAGIDFDHLLGYLGKMIEVTREAPANLGTAMKTIIARFEDMKKDPLAILEDGVSANKVEAALSTIGIALRDTAGEFRPLQEVFDELGMKWETLTRNQQAYIATVAAGSRQQSRFLAMMNNYDRTLDLITESQNSAGAAAEQYATYQDSIAAAQARLTASWEKLYSKIVDNDLIKIAINSISSLVDALSKVPPVITAIGVSIGAIGLQQLLSEHGGLIKIISNLLGGGGKDATIKNIGIGLAHKIYDGLKEGAKELDSRKTQEGLKFIASAFGNVKKDTLEATKNLEKVGKTGKSVGEVFKDIGEKGKVAFKGILNFIWDPKVLGILAVTAAVGALIYTVNKLNNRANDAAKKIQELNNEISNDKQILNSNTDLLKSYDELIKKVNRSEEEQEQLNAIINEMEETYDNAITWMDQYGNMHLSNRDDIAAENEELRENIRLKEQEVRNKQKNFLNETPSEQWNQENLTNSGFSASQVKKMLNAQKVSNEIKEIEEIANNLFIDESTLIDILQEKAKELNIYDLVANLFENEEYIDEYNSTISRYYTHSIDEIVKGMSNAISEGKNTVENVTEEFLHSIDIDELFAQYDIDSKHSAIISYYKMIVSSLPVEDFENAKEEINNTIKQILQITDNDKIIEAFNLVKKFYNQEITVDEYIEEMNKLGVQLGESIANGYIEGINEKKEDIRQNTIQAVQDALGITVSNSDTAYVGLNEDQLQTRSDLANTIAARAEVGKEGYITGVEGSKILAEAAPIVDEINDLIKTSLESGSYEGFITGLNNIIQKLPELGLSDAATDLIKDTLNDAEQQIEDANLFSKVFDEAQTKIQDFMSSYKESMDSVLSGKNTKLSDTDMTTSDNGVYIDPDTGEAMVAVVKTLSDLEKERSIAAFETSKAYLDVFNKLEISKNTLQSLLDKQNKLTKEGKELTQEDKERLGELKKQINQLENQESILKQQYNLLNKMKINNEQAGWATSISLAKDYQSNLKSIQSIQETIKKQGFLDVSDMETILNIMPQYAQYFDEVGNTIAGVEGKIYTITEENIENIMKAEKARYDYKLAIQQKEAVDEYNIALADYNRLIEMYGKEADADYQTTQEKITNRQDEVNATEESAKDTIELYEQGASGELQVQADKDTQMIEMFVQTLQQMGVTYEEFLRQLETGEVDLSGFIKGISSKAVESNVKIGVEWDFDPDSDPDKRKALIQALVEEAKGRMEAAWQKLQSLKSIDVPGLEKLKKDFENTGKGAEKTEKALKDLIKTAEELTGALQELDDLLINVKKELKDIDVDYNPFTDLFEAWEHEWDYYYNIKRLLQQIDTQGQYIDNIISADYISADKRIEAEHAKVGNLLAKMSANDTYIEALRAGMSQTAVELMKDYGEYYKVDPTTGQLYQTDKNLNDINELMNERKQEIYDLQKLQNEKENDLNLENAKLEALEQEKSAYEDILSTIESQYDSLKDNEDITVDISGLEKEKTELKAKINITDESIEAQKDKIRKMEDDIQDIEVGITLKDQDFQKLEDYVSDMEDKVSEYEEYWENLNSTIAEQQELLSNLNELYKGYVDTAISTQQELYDAIVENYQDEINQKKKQYDYFKQLDNDYLQSIKDNINKERQAREDANKQKNYQQNIQRAQLLQMDTSGAYRNELADLNKEIENQRQDLYDDLVDKQVEALEKEMDKRHELYDKEIAALEERLAYYQENAILLWEMVNGIVAEGANTMMATLENTTAYINSNELAKDQQRQTWEYNVKKTFDGVQKHTIDTLNSLIRAGNNFIINKYPEIGTALDDYKQVFIEASDAINEYNSQLISSRDILNNDTEMATQVFQSILDSFMTTWNDRTNEFTGYAQNWVDITNSLKQQTEDNLSDLRDLYDEQGRAIESAIGSIQDYDQSLRNASAEIYQDFLDERRSYREELETLVNQIQRDIGAAIGDAAGEIRSTADSISYNPTPNSSTNSGNNGITTPSTGSSGYNNIEEPDQYKITGQYRYIEENGQNRTATKTLDGFDSREEAIEALYAYLKGASKGFRWRSYNLESYGISAYAQGGLASFTGPAWLDGTKSNPERVLSPKQTKLFESMVSSLERTANNSNINSPFNSSYNIGDINTTIQVEKLDNEKDKEKVARQVENRIMKTIRNRVSISVA